MSTRLMNWHMAGRIVFELSRTMFAHPLYVTRGFVGVVCTYQADIPAKA